MKVSKNHDAIDQRQFEKLFKLHFQQLHGFAKNFVQDSDTARDICQQVFIQFWEKRNEIDTTRSLKSWLFTAVRNKCLNHIRDHKKYRSQVLDLDCGYYNLYNEQHDEVEEQDLKNQINVALDSLPDKCRQVFEMSRFGDMKYREIADELNISQKTVEAHMSKAIKVMRSALKHYLFWVYCIYCFL